MNCPKCEYEWEPRTEQPKECPQCKTRLQETVKRRENDNSTSGMPIRQG